MNKDIWGIVEGVFAFLLILLYCIDIFKLYGWDMPMKNNLQEIGETITAIAIIGLAIAIGIAGITLCFKLVGHPLGAH